MKNKELHSEFTFQIEPKHYFKHNYLTYCNDVLVSMLKYADEEKMASVSIDHTIPSERFCEPRQRNLINAEDGIIYKDL